MKTIAKIDPEKEYKNAKAIIDNAGKYFFDEQSLSSLDNSLEKLITAARVLIEREELRRGKKKAPKATKLKGRQEGDKRKEVKKLPSERYAELEVREDIIFPAKAPKCPCCNSIMKASGLYDVTEKLEVIPKQYYIQRNKRPKFNCGVCHGAIVNTPALASVLPSSNYSDSFIIDVVLSKFCDLIPMERYVQIASRNGLEGLPAQSLIGLTHQLADFLHGVYLKIKAEVLLAKILLADETTHKMLEGDETSNWYLWGFFCSTSSYFEAHGTRSGDVVFEFLKESCAQYLITDGYTGYNKAVKKVKKELNKDVVLADCNAHAVRYFKEVGEQWEDDTAPFLELYGDIYDLEKQKKRAEETKEQTKMREQMVLLFEELKNKCEVALPGQMPGSKFEKALKYFLNHYEGLTICTQNIDIPLDNNHSEREVRPPVVGRKTWYGTHSKRGAETLQVHFSIVSSCKVNNINPRNYYPWIVERILEGEEVLTPYEYSKFKETQ